MAREAFITMEGGEYNFLVWKIQLGKVKSEGYPPPIFKTIGVIVSIQCKTACISVHHDPFGSRLGQCFAPNTSCVPFVKFVSCPMDSSIIFTHQALLPLQHP